MVFVGHQSLSSSVVSLRRRQLLSVIIGCHHPLSVVFICGRSLVVVTSVVVGCQSPLSVVSPRWVVDDSGRSLSSVVVVGGHRWLSFIVVGGQSSSSIIRRHGWSLLSSMIIVGSCGHQSWLWLWL